MEPMTHNDSDSLIDSPQIDLAAESFATDSADFSHGDEAEAILTEDDAAEDLAD